MWRMVESDIISGGSQGFKTIEEVCTQKINKVIENGSCKNALALLYNDRGHAKYMQVEFDSAVADFDRALHFNPNLAVAYYNRATILYRMGNFKGALRDMQKAVDLDPSNMEFHEGYSECLKLNNVPTQ